MPEFKVGDEVILKHPFRVVAIDEARGSVTIRGEIVGKFAFPKMPSLFTYDIVVPVACLDVVPDATGERVAEAVSSGQMVVSESIRDALSSLALNGYAVVPNRVPLDTDDYEDLLTLDGDADDCHNVGNASQANPVAIVRG